MIDYNYYYKIGLSLYSLKRYTDALVYFDNAEGIYFDNTNRGEKDELILAFIFFNKGLTHNKVGIKYYDKKQFSKAIDCFDESINIFNKLSSYSKDKQHYQDKELHHVHIPTIIALIRYNCGYAHGELQKYEKAKEYYDLAKEYFETDAKLKLELADVYRGIGYVHAQLNQMKEAMTWFEESKRIEPNFAYVYNTKGYVLNLQERYGDAIKCFDKAIEKDPSFGRPLRNKGYALNSLGRSNKDIKESENKYKEALDCINRAISIEPRDAFSWFYKGYSYIYLKKYDEAIGCFDKAIEIRPDDFAYAYNTKGVTLYHFKKFDQAIDCFSKAIEISEKKLSNLTVEPRKIDWIKQLGDAYNNKGYALNLLERYKEAIEYFDNAKYTIDNIKTFNNQDVSIEDLRKQNIFSLIYKGIALFNLKRYNEAIEYLNQAFGPYTKYNGIIYLTRGKSNYMLERYPEAKGDFMNMSEQYLIEKYYNLALCYEKEEPFKEMEEYYLKVINANFNLQSKSIQQSKVFAYYNLGIFYYNKDNLDDAKRMFENCLSIDPDFIQAREALKKLKSKQNNNMFSWWFPKSQKSENLSDNEGKIKLHNKLKSSWEKDIKRKVGIALPIIIGLFVIFIIITAYLNLSVILFNIHDLEASKAPEALTQINGLAPIVMAMTAILLVIFLLPLPISKKINFGGEVQIEIEKIDETPFELTPLIPLEAQMPPDSISYPLESYAAPLEHPIHMPPISAMSYELHHYESQIIELILKEYNK